MRARPFYIKASIDGRASELVGGPANGKGEMQAMILQRDEGVAIPILKITTHNETINGKHMLTTKAWDTETNTLIFEKTTNY